MPHETTGTGMPTNTAHPTLHAAAGPDATTCSRTPSTPPTPQTYIEASRHPRPRRTQTLHVASRHPRSRCPQMLNDASRRPRSRCLKTLYDASSPPTPTPPTLHDASRRPLADSDAPTTALCPTMLHDDASRRPRCRCLQMLHDAP